MLLREDKGRILGSGSLRRSRRVHLVRDQGELRGFSKTELWVEPEFCFSCRSLFSIAHMKYYCCELHVPTQPLHVCCTKNDKSQVCLLFLLFQDNGPAQGRRPVPPGAGGNPMDTKQMLNVQHHHPTRLYGQSGCESALPGQLSGLHIAPAQR